MFTQHDQWAELTSDALETEALIDAVATKRVDGNL